MNSSILSIRLAISAITLLIAGSLALLLLGEGIFFGRQLALSATDQLFTQITEKTTERTESFNQRPEDLISLLNPLPQLQSPPQPGTLHPATSLFVRAMRTNRNLYGLHVGDENGNFFMVANMTAWPAFRKQKKMPEKTRWAVISIITDRSVERQRIWEYLDTDLRLLATKVELSAYDPRNRPWFVAAQKSKEMIKTEPYVYSSLQTPGVTYAMAIPGSNRVLGVDITLTSLSRFMAEQKITENSEAFLFNEMGTLSAFPDPSRIIQLGGTAKDTAELANIQQLYPELEAELLALAAAGGGTQVLSNGTGEFMTLVKPLNKEATSKEYLALLVPLDEILQPYRQSALVALTTAILSILLFMPLAWYTSSRISGPIKKLADETKKVENLQFDEVCRIDSRIAETALLSESFYGMAHSIGSYRASLLHTGKKLQLLVELGIALTTEKDQDKLMEMILSAAKDLSNADGGTLYIREDKQKEDQLRFEIIRNDSLKIALGGTTGEDVELPAVLIRNRETGEENHNNVVSHSVLLEKTVNIVDAYTDTEFDFSGTRVFDEKSGYRSQSFLTVPLKPRGADVIGALQLINAMDSDGKVITFSQETQDFVEALAAQAAVALENRNLVLAQTKLLDSIVKLIASAIDAKSPYTAGHCKRVPALCLMLAEEAGKASHSAFKDFRIESEDEWRELSIGAWLHDCGKLTTPEYVVNKATKLETLYDRFHEVRTRFEVLRRDAEIDYLTALLQQEQDPATLQQELEDKLAELEDDFSFLAACNQGGEFMAEEKIERLQQIAKRSWLRHFDDRVGLSREETLRMEAMPAAPLPVKEPLLADKPEHIIPRTTQQDLYSEGNPYDIKMKVPENLYNRGEIYNLSVQRGTLTEEERFKINEHIIQTIVMLQQLPFPKQFSRVAEYAGAHHETLIGTGYPRGLKAEQLSIPARIMAIADIFEALTASDRPYKHPKSLSESIRIMHFMRKDQHIDSDLFELFLSQGVYKRYAQDYLKPEQIDEVDLSKYLS